MQRRLLFAVLVQLADRGAVDRATIAAMVPGADEQDLIEALENLLDDGSIEVLENPLGESSVKAENRLDESSVKAENRRAASLLDLAEAGRLTLTPFGRSRVDDADGNGA